MKLATLKDGSRDGTLAVVSHDLTKMAPASAVARTLQIALEKWTDAVPRLAQLYEAVNAGIADGLRDYDPEALESPLPRTYQFVDGSAYLNHVELFRKARGAKLTPKLREVPLMYQAVSDGFLRPTGAIPVADPELGVDMEAEVGVIVDDVPMAVRRENAAQHIKLFVLINDVSLRTLIPDELNFGLGYFHGKPRSSLSPVAVTPDELGDAWDGRKVHLDMVVKLNQAPIGMPNCGVDMDFDFTHLIAHAAKTRPLCAGTLIGSGAISNRDPGTGVACLAELRIVQQIDEGRQKTSFMQYGDRATIEMFDANNQSVFGAIDQEIIPV
ncbi:MAG: fumarylacetoacetate hydrolase family protein [Alphaproteobacteria bacterium]|nr:fumarylacetoacetate hydrolase family protein [Alphaproteobacteria bacterium]